MNARISPTRRPAILALLLLVAPVGVHAAPAPPRSARALPYSTGLTGRSFATTSQVTAGETFETTFPIVCNGGPSRVGLSATVLPAGFQATVDPSETDTPNRAVKVTAPTAPTTPPGLYEIRIKATHLSGACKDTDPFLIFRLEVVKPEIRLEVSPERQALGLGESVDFDVRIRKAPGQRDTVVSLSASGLPRGVTATFAPQRTAGDVSRLTLAAAPGAKTVEDRKVEVLGEAKVPVGSGTLTLDVLPAVRLRPAPATASVTAPGRIVFTFFLEKIGYSGPVGLDTSLSGPAQFGISLQRIPPEPFTSLDAISVEVQVTEISLPGRYTIRAEPRFPPEAPPVKPIGATVTFDVTGPPVRLEASPGTRTIAAGGSATFDLRIVKAEGFTGEVSFAGGDAVPGGMPPVPDRVVEPTRVVIATDATGTPPSTYTLKFRATYRQDGRDILVESNAVDLVVQATGGARLTADGTLMTVMPGGDLVYPIGVQRFGSFRGTVVLDLEAPPPAPIAFAFDPADREVPPDRTDAKLTFTAPAGSPLCQPIDLKVGGSTRDPAGLPVTAAPIRFQVIPALRLEASPSVLELGDEEVGESTLVVTPDPSSLGLEVAIQGPDFPPSPSLLEFRLEPTGNGLAKLIVTNHSASLELLDFTLEIANRPCEASETTTFVTVRKGSILGKVTVSAVPPAQSVEAGRSAVYSLALGGGAGQPVQLAAGGLPPGATATFSPNPAPGGSATLTVAVPATAPPGSYRLAVSATAGVSSPATIPLDLMVTAPPPPTRPEIGGFFPLSGAPGTPVQIVGANLAGAASVAFNGAPAAFSVDPQGRIDATVPAVATTGPIQVTTPAGTALSPTPFAVTAGAPVVTDLQPRSGLPGDRITVAGVRLAGATGVTFGGASAPFAVVSDNFLAATVPVGAATGPVAVTTPSGTAASPFPFTVTAPAPPSGGPTISSFFPTSGTTGTSVTVNGANLGDALDVRFGGLSARPVNVSSTAVTATVPLGAASGPIVVITPRGMATSPVPFVVLAVPVVIDLQPRSGMPGDQVTIAGGMLRGTTRVTFGGVSAPFAVASDDLLLATVPAGAASGPVQVTTPAGVATSPFPFTVITAGGGAPTISSFTPSSGPPLSLVGIFGTNFTGATSVSFGGFPAADFTVFSPTFLRAAVPDFARSGPIRVTTPAGTATSAGFFTVERPFE